MSGTRWWLLGVLVWCAGVLATNSIADVPWWDADPLLSELPETSLTPGQVLILSGLGLLASVGLLVGSVRRGELGRRSVVVLGAIAVGGLGVLLHGLVLRPLASGDVVRGDLEGLVTGATWLSGLLGGFAVATVKARDRVLRLVLGVFVVLAVLMVAKALFERFVELPRTIALFEREREAVLIANGLEPGTAPAEVYERRLRSQQVTAWFGLANVLASVLAALTVLLLVSAVRAFGDVRAGRCSSGGAGLVGLVGLATAVSLSLTGSKGAIGVLLLVLGGALVLGVSGRVRNAVLARPGVAIASTGVVVFVGIVGRGLLLPESLERSVLFRWHYLIGTVRVWMENLLLGAGPGGFQDAYTRLKPAISPENVQTPHVLIADWVGAFGLLGLVVMAGLGFWLWSAESPEREGEPASEPAPGELVWCLLVSGAVLATSLGVQWAVVGGVLDLLLVLAIGLGVASATAWVLLGVWRRHPAWLRWGAIGAAALLIGHGMFDVAPARAGSAMLFWLVVGVGIGPVGGRVMPRRRWAMLLAAAGVMLGGLVAWAGGRQAMAVEPLLHESAQMVREPGALARSGEPFERASAVGPGWLKLDLARFGLEARVASAMGGTDELLELASGLSQRWPNSVEAQSAIAITLWSLRGDPVHGGALAVAGAQAASRASALAPHDVGPAYRAALMLRDAGFDAEAMELAVRALANGRQGRMDPLAGLRDEQLLRLRGEFPGLFSDGDGSADGAGGVE